MIDGFMGLMMIDLDDARAHAVALHRQAADVLQVVSVRRVLGPHAIKG